jgi:hypothetical protein
MPRLERTGCDSSAKAKPLPLFLSLTGEETHTAGCTS